MVADPSIFRRMHIRLIHTAWSSPVWLSCNRICPADPKDLGLAVGANDCLEEKRPDNMCIGRFEYELRFLSQAGPPFTA